MKNTTLSRKSGNTLKKNSGTSHEPRRSDQRGDGADFAFNGQMGDGVNRDESRAGICANPYSRMVRNPDSINAGESASSRRGNTSDQSRDRMESVGPSATRDEMRMTMSTAAQGHPVGAMKAPRKFANPDAINVGN